MVFGLFSMYVAQLKACDAVVRSEVFENKCKFSVCTFWGNRRCPGVWVKVPIY